MADHDFTKKFCKTEASFQVDLQGAELTGYSELFKSRVVQ